MFKRTMLFVLSLLLVPFAFAHAPALPAPAADGLFAPTSMAFTPDGRLFVGQKEGIVWIIKDGVRQNEPLVSIPADTLNERGLGGIAIDPNFASNGFVYLYYTTLDNPHNRVSRITVVGDSADPASEFVLIDDIPSTQGYHNGGGLQFGSDGKLYVATGDSVDPMKAQQLDRLNGKVLRINPDGSIPEDNPYVGQEGARPEVWALGLRNPFTIAFSSDGRLYANDVGHESYEEINSIVKGGNYGWPYCEGVCMNESIDLSTVIDPVHAYSHNGGHAAVTGGVFIGGDYFFADYLNNFIKRLTPSGEVIDYSNDVVGVVDLDVAADGDLYMLSVISGKVFTLEHVVDVPGVPHEHPEEPPVTPPTEEPPVQPPTVPEAPAETPTGQPEEPGSPVEHPPQEPAEAGTLAVLYSENSTYVFECQSPFEATSYDWFFGDGEMLIGISNRDVYHVFPEGAFAVECRAHAEGRQSVGALHVPLAPVTPVQQATIAVADWWPQGSSYVFVCDTSFNATTYDWTFGDGEMLLGVSNADVFHTFVSEGSYDVSCEASADGHRARGSMNVVATSNGTFVPPVSPEVPVIEAPIEESPRGEIEDPSEETPPVELPVEETPQGEDQKTISVAEPEGRSYVFTCNVDAETYSWTFGDGGLLNNLANRNVLYTFNTPGEYDVSCEANVQKAVTHVSVQ